jgi:hypothetical protein
VREGDGIFVSRFHPKKLVLACGIKNEIIFFSAANSFIPFSHWKKDENTFQMMEWNVISSL